MPNNVTREEFDARVGVLEREVDGEIIVTRHILEQTRRNGEDLAAVKTQLDRVETRLGGVETKVDTLTRDLPKIVADAMRDVLRERDDKA